MEQLSELEKRVLDIIQKNKEFKLETIGHSAKAMVNYIELN